MTDVTAPTDTLTIPSVLAASSVYVAYMCKTVEEVRRVAGEFDADLIEHHYDAQDHEPENWILVADWRDGRVHYTASGPRTSEPSQVTA